MMKHFLSCHLGEGREEEKEDVTFKFEEIWCKRTAPERQISDALAMSVKMDVYILCNATHLACT